MREISPAVGMSVDEYLNLAPEIRPLITEIRRQKKTGERPRPSTSLVEPLANAHSGMPYQAAGQDRGAGR